MKILLLADIPGWIVDRLCQRMTVEMPEIDWQLGYYGCMTTEEILTAAADVDLIHYGNWDIERHWLRILEADKPLLVSVRSHRFPDRFRFEVAPRVRLHVITRALQDEFPSARYVPDGVLIDHQRPRVGFAGKPGPYKRTEMIAEACSRVGADFVIAENLPPEQMPGWYRSIDVLVCASIAEGFAAPVFEARAMHRPVISVRSGSAWECNLPGVKWFDGTLHGLVEALTEFNSPTPEEFRWPSVAANLRHLYADMVRT